jgi:TetR/AcrR family transcriptional regulator, lmrAB and yxaGH operons repressor
MAEHAPRERASRSSSREAFVTATATLLRRQGYAATGLSDIVSESGAPRGSLYFHFPDGKEQLAVAAMRSSGDAFARLIEHLLSADRTPADAVDTLVSAMAAGLEASSYEEGCPIATITLEAATGSPAISQAAAESFSAWTTEIEAVFLRAGLDARTAGRRATLVLSALEGALILARARRDLEPLSSVREELSALLA